MSELLIVLKLGKGHPTGAAGLDDGPGAGDGAVDGAVDGAGDEETVEGRVWLTLKSSSSSAPSPRTTGVVAERRCCSS